MSPDIRFPNLGLELNRVIRHIQIGNFSIAIYGLCIALGMLVGILIMQKRVKETEQDQDFYSTYIIWAILVSVIGARLYYVIFSLDEYKNNWISIFNLRAGGLAIYGSVIAAVIFTYFYSKKKNISFGQVADTCAMGLIAGQAIGRWGNFFNREAFGTWTNSLFAMQIKAYDVTQGNINADAVTKVVEYANEKYIQVHPTFLYESFWNIGVLIVLFVFRNKVKFKGELFLLYLGLYGLGRFFIEGLRTDQLRLGSFAVSQVFALIMVVFSIITVIYLRKRKSVLGQ